MRGKHSRDIFDEAGSLHQGRLQYFLVRRLGLQDAVYGRHIAFI
jgi:hypothetical protein